jgi:ppGpp synthetase/RelA/SpoT-type nucleotidyltranferase
MRDELLENYKSRISLLNQLADNLDRESREALQGLPHVDRISYRVKCVKSFLDKARDPKNVPPYKEPLVEIEDQVAGRVLVFFLSDIEPAISQLNANFTRVESSRRRPQKDEEFGYESHHLICLIPPQAKPAGWNAMENLPKTFELQVRTLFMHAWAEPQHDLGYKGPDDLPRDIRRELSWVAASSWGADQAFDRIVQWQRKKPEASPRK